MLSNGQIVLEQEILGSLFKNEDLIIKAKEKIKPEMFLYSKHMNIYLGILEMVENKMKVELITFLEYHRGKINEMDGVTYVSEIFTCSISDFAFNTKMDLLIDNYKKHLYIEMASRINEDMSFESIESEIENVKVKIHKCGIRKELEITKQYDDYVKWLYEEERDKGMSTGIRVIDRYIGNLQTGRVVTVFASPLCRRLRERGHAVGNGRRADRARAAVGHVKRHVHRLVAAQRLHFNRAAAIAFGEHRRVLRAGIAVHDHHILFGQRRNVLILNRQLPQLRQRGLAGVQIARVKGLRDGRRGHGGKRVAQDVLRGLLVPVIFLAAVFHALADDRPNRRGRRSGIQEGHQQFAGNRLARGCVKSRTFRHNASPFKIVVVPHRQGHGPVFHTVGIAPGQIGRRHLYKCSEDLNSASLPIL